ncbi:MAG TPA: hypothetical protein VF527_10700 [Pyrinomonadaceae bacterium]
MVCLSTTGAADRDAARQLSAPGANVATAAWRGADSHAPPDAASTPPAVSLCFRIQIILFRLSLARAHRSKPEPFVARAGNI